MIIRNTDFISEKYDQCCGGLGIVDVINLLTQEEMYKHPKCMAYAKIQQGSSIGWHIHENEMEAYFIIKGQGIFNDNGLEHIVNPMEITITYDGEGHSIKPTNGENNCLELLAFIIGK